MDDNDATFASYPGLREAWESTDPEVVLDYLDGVWRYPMLPPAKKEEEKQ